MRVRYQTIGCVVATLLCVATAMAGTLDSTAAPDAVTSYTLKDLYNRLELGTAGATQIFTEPAAGPGATMHTINDIMAKAPALDAANGAIPANVANGKTFWGLTAGEWGLKTGIMTTQTLSDANATVNAGYYAATTLNAVDADLTAANIKSGVNIFGVAGTAAFATYPAPVSKTGQTTCYDSTGTAIPCAGTGQDGALQKGVAYPAPRFTDNGNGTVTDNLTGLIWLKNANVPAATRNWATALADVVQLNTNGKMNGNASGDTSNAGSYQTDWRLPNIKELQSLIDFAYINPSLCNTAGTEQWTPNTPFTNVQDSQYWSSTTAIATNGTGTVAWYIFMSHGRVDRISKTGNAVYYVWPVRGGQ